MLNGFGSILAIAMVISCHNEILIVWFKVNKQIMWDLSQKNKQNLLCIDEKDGKKITLNMNKKGWLAWKYLS